MDDRAAEAVNTLLSYLGVNALLSHLGLEPSSDESDAPTDPDRLVAAAVLLADQASAALGSGVNGQDVHRCWASGPPQLDTTSTVGRFAAGAYRVALQAGLDLPAAAAFERAMIEGDLRGLHPRIALPRWLARQATPGSPSAADSVTSEPETYGTDR